MLGPFVHAAEIVGHLVFEVAMYGVMDIAIAGFGCHNPRDGLMQLCVRPLEQHGTSIELPPKPDPTEEGCYVDFLGHVCPGRPHARDRGGAT